MSATIYTPTFHASVSTLKPVKVISTSTTGEHGPWALIEFEGGFSRIVDLPHHTDANHVLFASLDWPDRWQLRHAAALVVPMADGTVKVNNSALSFTTVTLTKRGACIAGNNFDVPAEHPEAGYLTGLRAARELLGSVKQGGANCTTAGRLRDILVAATAAVDNGKTCEPSQCWAAWGFMLVITETLVGAAQNLTWGRLIDTLESNHVNWLATSNQHEAEQKAQRIAKSIATRKARAAERKAAKVMDAA